MKIVNQALILSLLMVTVPFAGCTFSTSGPLTDDTDGDGVVDALDLCPNTPPNTFVDSNGCEAPCPDFKVWDDLRDDHDLYGSSVETDGVSVIVGARGTNVAPAPTGQAFVYICGSDGWELQAELSPNSALQAGDQFGLSVAILGEYAIVGAPNSDVVDNSGTTQTNAGMAYIFARDSAGVWTEQVKLIEDVPNANAQFGWSVDLGNTGVEQGPNFDILSDHYNAAVGAPGSNAVTGYKTGAAYFYTTDSSGNEFAHTIRLEASAQWHDGSQCTGCGTFSGPWNWGGYGVDVAIYRNTVVVGSSLEKTLLYNSNANYWMHESGAIYVFDRVIMTAGVHAIQETVRINTPDAEYCNPFDNIVQVTLSNGQVMNWSTCNNHAYFGRSVDIYDDTIVVGAAGPMSWGCWGSVKEINGSAYVFEKTNNGWDENVYVQLSPSINTAHNYPPPRQAFSYNTHAFGWEVSIYRDIVFVGSPVRSWSFWYLDGVLNIPDVGLSDGNSYLFARTQPLTWNEVAIVDIPDIIRAPGYSGWMFQEQGAVHHEVAIGGRYVILGSPVDDVRPVNWVPFTPNGNSNAPGAGWPTDEADFTQGGENTGSAYICHYDDNNQVYCEWSDDMYPNGSFTWGSYSIANDSRRDNSTMEWPVSECPYEDKMMCDVMGYLYDEVGYDWRHFEDLPNCTGDRFNYTLNGTWIILGEALQDEDYESRLILSSCLNPMDDTENGTGDNNSNNSNDGGDVVRGCTDPEAENYDPEATRDDGSCTYKGEEESERDDSQES